MNAVVVTQRSLNWLKTTRAAQLLHLFPSVCNLVNERNEVLSLATADIGPGPFTMIVPRAVSRLVTTHTAVRINRSSSAISIGEQTFSSQRATVWNARPPWARFEPGLLERLPPAAPIQELVEERLQALISAIRSNDREACRSAVRTLAGVGDGLTPVGDDVLVGVLYGLWAWQPDQDLIALLVDEAAPRTTTLSAAFLRAAQVGEATWPWHHLVAGDRHAVRHIMSTGATSGIASWTGFAQLGHALAG